MKNLNQSDWIQVISFNQSGIELEFQRSSQQRAICNSNTYSLSNINRTMCIRLPLSCSIDYKHVDPIEYRNINYVFCVVQRHKLDFEFYCYFIERTTVNFNQLTYAILIYI